MQIAFTYLLGRLNAITSVFYVNKGTSCWWKKRLKFLNIIVKITNIAILTLHDVGNNRDCDVDVDHRNNTTTDC